jgi:hypothetical protein
LHIILKKIVCGGRKMYEELVEIVENFIELCDKLLENGKIDLKLYNELTKNKIEFLRKEESVG